MKNVNLSRVQKHREKSRKKCPTCDSMILAESKSCKSCHHASRILIDDTRSLNDLIYTKHHKSSAYALIRARARNVCKDEPCIRCGYDLHTEVAHKRPISSFDGNTPISEVNSKENLMRLCPNCHWEYDRGFWTF